MRLLSTKCDEVKLTWTVDEDRMRSLLVSIRWRLTASSRRRSAGEISMENEKFLGKICGDWWESVEEKKRGKVVVLV